MKEQIIEKMSNLITSAFGLVAALAWNDAIKAIFASYYPKGEDAPPSGLLIYAVIVTIIAVVATVWIGRVAAGAKDLL